MVILFGKVWYSFSAFPPKFPLPAYSACPVGVRMTANRALFSTVDLGPPPTMQPMNPRMAGPHQSRGVPPMGPGGQMNNMGQFPPSMRPPNGPNGPVNGQPQPNGQMPINM